MQVEIILVVIGSSLFFILGTIHLLYTFFTDKFSPRTSTLEAEMKATSPILTRQTTVWNAWIGFNASHSLGAIFFGIVNIILVTQYFSVLHDSIAFQIVNLTTIFFYLFLAKKYWFKIPLRGIFISALCFIVASILFHLR